MIRNKKKTIIKTFYIYIRQLAIKVLTSTEVDQGRV